MTVCDLCVLRHDDGRGPGVGERTPLPALHPPQLPRLRVPRGAPVPHRHADHVHPPRGQVVHQGHFTHHCSYIKNKCCCTVQISAIGHI